MVQGQGADLGCEYEVLGAVLGREVRTWKLGAGGVSAVRYGFR